MKDLVIFQNEEFGSIRVRVDDQGETWFVGRDIAITLGYSNTSTALDRHVEEEDKQLSELVDYQLYEKSITDNQENREVPKWQKVVWVNESGVFSLILGSKLPNAKKYKRWVTSEVLPSIYRTGKYEVPMSSAPVSEEIRARLREIDLKRAEFLERMAEKQTIASYKEIIHSYAVNIVAENQALPLPKVVEHTYTATEVASMIGTTSWRVGNLAKEYGIKGKPGAVTEYGEWFKDKAAYSDKEVETFRYNQKGIDKLRELYHSWSKREIK